MNRLRIVINAFAAKKYAKIPTECVNFNVGDKVVFWKHPDADGPAENAYVIFGHEHDKARSDPFVTDTLTFKANTEDA